MTDSVLRRVSLDRWKTIPLDFVDQDETLSWKAVGILTYMLTRPDGWAFYRADLVNRHTDGRDAVKSGLMELRSQGYLRTKPFPSGGWQWFVSDRPRSEEEWEAIMEGDSEGGKSEGGKSAGGKPVHIEDISTSKKKRKRRDIGETADLFGEGTIPDDGDQGPPYDDLWRILVDELFDGETARRLTDKRRKKLRAVWEEHLEDHPAPLDFFRKILLALKADEWWGTRPGTWLPEKAFRNAERREQFAVAAAEGRIEPKGEAPDWLSGLEEEGGWGN